ncbi:Mfs1.1 [Coprinopsis marcescibilis]|uniref:Mfs1.1 n=1 Tax=Coprinopsis marcescibilis TaxID=230819 RepID=A0A5C3LEL5_COPMA|nr:Mfs1.1 [Coprinopsis marcescibilis]
MSALKVESQISDSPTDVATNPAPQGASSSSKKGLRFWLIFLALSFTTFLSALDYTALAAALPVIVHDLKGSDFAWIGTAYTLTSTAFLPMSGGLAQILGRRSAFILALAFFALGSALCGSAQDMNWMIAARAIQGVGSGAIVALASIIISDLVTLQERGTYNGLLGLTWTVSLALGPLIGGAMADRGIWRWIFYINLPVSGVAFILATFFMTLPTPQGSFKDKFFAMDWIGNALVACGSTGLVLALTWGGGTYPWSSAAVLVPLVLGVAFLVGWIVYEVKIASHPTVAPELIGNRTSVSGYLQTFLVSLIIAAWMYYIPVYFQACKDASPTQAGISMFGGTMVVGPFIVASGISVTATQKYRPQLWFGWVLLTVGFGVMGIVGAATPSAQPIAFSAILSAGAGIIFSVAYFPVLSPLPVSLNARALALFIFLRVLAQVWGISFGSVILTNELTKRLPAEFLQITGDGVERVFGLIPSIPNLAQPLKADVQHAFAESIRPVWYTMTGIAFLGLLSSLMMADIPLHNKVDESWRLEGKSTVTQQSSLDMEEHERKIVSAA